MTEMLTTGNSAKVYCLNWINDYLIAHDGKARILDLGSGVSNNFVKLLKKFPDADYIGIEPSAGACEVARKNLQGTKATIINDFAYDMMGRLVHEPADIIVSFSVMEHVYQRLRHLQSASACMDKDSYFLINYDAGHFVSPSSIKERVKNIVGPILAQFGNENYYQKFVKEADFRAMVQQSGLVIAEAKSFNTILKGIHKSVHPDHQDEHMRRWLAHELWLNDHTPPYDDSHAKDWFSRNFILRKA